MKTTLLSILVLGSISSTMAFECPKNVLVKKEGAKTFYSTDLSTKYTSKKLSKNGCSVKIGVMSKDQNIAVIQNDAKTKINKL